MSTTTTIDTAPDVSRVRHRYCDLGGVRLFYRESVPVDPDAPVLLLLHGFPSSSHQFRRLIDAVGARYRVIAPDYPGFGHTETDAGFTFTFDALADVMEEFLRTMGVTTFFLYVFDFGAPVGFRLLDRLPDAALRGLVVQNANAYEEGLSDAARDYVSLDRATPGAEDTVRALLSLDGTRYQYEHGTRDRELLPPESWLVDQHFLELPGRKDAQVALAFDYRTNVTRYPEWQEWLRTHRPPTAVVWGENDPFFLPAGARAYLGDLPDARLVLLPAGHFALEDHLPELVSVVDDLVRHVLGHLDAA